MLPVLLWQAPRPPAGEFELLAADVGQGNAVLVRTATHTLVYDAGPGYSRETDAGQRVLVPLLRAWGETVDLLVLSHRDSDHTGGAAAVLRMQPGARLLGSLEPGHPLQALRPALPCRAGQQWDWDGVHFELLHPAATMTCSA
jgi:competence protein ComEC